MVSPKLQTDRRTETAPVPPLSPSVRRHLGRSLQVFYQIPFAMVQLIQAIIVICVAASEFLMRHRLHWVR